MANQKSKSVIIDLTLEGSSEDDRIPPIASKSTVKPLRNESSSKPTVSCDLPKPASYQSPYTAPAANVQGSVSNSKASYVTGITPVSASNGSIQALKVSIPKSRNRASNTVQSSGSTSNSGSEVSNPSMPKPSSRRPNIPISSTPSVAEPSSAVGPQSHHVAVYEGGNEYLYHNGTTIEHQPAKRRRVTEFPKPSGVSREAARALSTQVRHSLGNIPATDDIRVSAKETKSQKHNASATERRTSGAGYPVRGTFSQTEPRKFHIGTTKKDDVKGLGFYGPGSSQPRIYPNSGPPVIGSDKTRPEYISSGDELEPAYNADLALKSFKPRSNGINKSISRNDVTNEVKSAPGGRPVPGRPSKKRRFIPGGNGRGGRYVDEETAPNIPVETGKDGHPYTGLDRLLGNSPVSPVREQVPDMQRPALPTANNGQTAPTVITIIPPSVPPNLLSYGSLHWAQQEDYLLIYLKEVLQLTWLEIIEHYPNRTRASIQTHYSSYLNKRDRSKDPLDLTQAISAVRGDTTVPAVATISTPVKVPPSIVPKPATARNPSVQQVIPSQESVLSLNRPRRSTQPVNYTWPRRNQSFMMHPEESTEDGRQDQPHSRSLSIRLRSSEPSEEPAIVPETAYPVDKPLELNVEEEDAKTALAASQPRVFPPSGTQLPYLDSAQRQLLHKGPEKGEWDLWSGRDWQGTILHVDFHDEELELVERMAVKVMGPGSRPQFASIRRRIQRMLKNEPAHRIFKLSHEIVLRMNSRDRSSIDAFLRDAANGQISTAPRIERIGAVRQSRAHSSNPRPSTSSLLRQRELGLQSRRGWKDTSRPLSYQMKNNIFDTMGPAYSYTGASSDVHTVAWSPDGQCFAAGAVCVTDPDSMQYNRPNNLLYGDVTNKVIHELADHYTARYRPEKGANASHAMFASQDPKLYTTVSMVEFSPDGQYMYSTGYDRYAVMWETKSDGSQPESLRKFLHRAPVDLLTVSCNGLVATAAKKWTARSIKVMTIRGPEDIHNDSFTSSKAIERPDMKVLPTALKFEPNYGRLLLGGFGANVREDGLDSSGDICLWDVTTQQQLWVHGSTKNVFDLAFNPRQREAPFFAVGCVAGGQVNRGTRSVVRFYDCRVQGAGKYSMMMELECPALDMNDVVYCPYDDALFAAGCTDGSAYVWDVRKPDSFLYKLSHGKPLMQLDENQPREVTDTGIRFCSWGENSTRLFTGSSDGVVKIWDVARATDDVFIKDIATFDSGVMSGAFSPDKSRLVVGEVNGSVNVLEVGRDDCSVKNTERLRYVAYEDLDEPDTPFPSRADAESGKAIAEEMLKSGQMVLRPMGGLPVYQAVQGPNYNGPWDSSWSAPPLRDQALFSQAAFNVNPGPQCDISACGDLSRMATFTAEEMGDSGRSKDRIPDEMRKLWFGTPSFGNEHIFTAVLGKTKCDRCNLPAIPDENIDSAETGNFCEFCSFDCFRCGAPVLPDYNPGEGPLSYARASALERIQCRNCKRAWEVGVLGYKCVQDKGDPDAADERDVPRLKGYGRDLARERFECGAENEDEVTTFGDEMNALSEYYLGLTVKRPESPL